MQRSAQSSFQKLDVDNSCQKTCKIRYYIFEPLSKFTAFFYFLGNAFPGLSNETNFWPYLGPVFFILEFFDIFLNFKAFLQSR